MRNTKTAVLDLFRSPFLLLWSHRNLLVQTVRNDIKTRFAGSALGFVWLILQPLLFLGVYALVFQFVFRIRFGDLFSGPEYVLLIFCGLVPFLGFAETLSTGVTSVTSNAGLIKNTLFPIELTPVKTVFASQFSQIVGLIMLLIAAAFMGKLSRFSLMIPVIWLFQIFFSLGLVWLFSSLNVFLRDLQHITAILILALQMLSPIAYTIDMVPEGIRPFMGINPLYYIIAGYQDCLMMGRFPQTLIPLAGIATGTLLLGCWFFRRLKSVFIDNV